MYEARLGLVQKISTRYKSTFRRFPGPRRESDFQKRKVFGWASFPTYRAQKLMKRGRGGVGDEGIYGGGGVGPSETRRICACRPHFGRSKDMRLEEFGLHLRELELIEIFARWGVFPMLSEFSLFAASLQDVSTFFPFLLSKAKSEGYKCHAETMMSTKS